MSVFPAIHGVVIPAIEMRDPPGRYNPKWVFHHISPRVTSEGEPVTFSLKCDNAVVGARTQLYMTGASLGSSGNWVESWTAVLKRVCEPLGCTVEVSTSVTVPPKVHTVAWTIKVTSAYTSGTVMEFTNVCKKNRRNNATNYGDIRGGPGTFQIYCLNITAPPPPAPLTATQAYGTVMAVGSIFFDIRDTSRRPLGYPIIKVTTYAPDGSVSPASLNETDKFDVEIYTENMIPGTKVKLYAANEGQKDVTPSWPSGLKSAAEAAGCECFVPTYNDDPEGWFRGGIITYTDNYNDSRPIRVSLEVAFEAELEKTKQFDIIGQIVAEGDASEFDNEENKGVYNSALTYNEGNYVNIIATGRSFIATQYVGAGISPPTDEETVDNAFWREFLPVQNLGLGVSKQLKDNPATFWEIHAKKPSNGSYIQYRVGYPYTLTQPSTVVLVSENTPHNFLEYLDIATPEDKFVPAEGIYKYIRVVADEDDDPTNDVIPDTIRFYSFLQKSTLYIGPSEAAAAGYASIEEYWLAEIVNKKDYYYDQNGKVRWTVSNMPTRQYKYTFVVTTPEKTILSPLKMNMSDVDVRNDPDGVTRHYITLHCAVTSTNFPTDYATEDPTIRFSVPVHGSDSGRHRLWLRNASDGYITVPEVCAYITGKPASANDPYNIYGINAAGGEFNDAYIKKVSVKDYGNLPVGAKVPYGGGRYYYPSKPQEDDPADRHLQMDYFYARGARIMRLPVKWERIQPVLYGPLYYGPDEPFTSSNDLDMRRILECIDYWTNTLGGYVLLDLHNYMGYIQRLVDPVTGLVGSVSGKVKYDSELGLDIYALIDIWLKLANLFADNTKVWFGIMNEPSGDGATASRTAKNMQAVVNMIRCRTLARNKILVAGSSFSNCRKWVLNGVAKAFEEFYDPLDNFAFEPHNYIDADQSGTKGNCVIQTEANNQLKDFTEWARPLGFRGFLGEFAGGSPTVVGQEQCAFSVPATYRYMKNNRDVWLGWTTWGGGFPAGYVFSLEPSGNNYRTGTDSGGMQMLIPFLEEEL